MSQPKRAKETHALLTALVHPARRQILRAIDGAEITCPSVVAEQLDRPLDNVAYHMRALATRGAARLVRTEQVAGATRHIYRPATMPLWVQEVLDATEGETPGSYS
jgi:DNA-binding transcriptional ArsR family regulator